MQALQYKLTVSCSCHWACVTTAATVGGTLVALPGRLQMLLMLLLYLHCRLLHLHACYCSAHPPVTLTARAAAAAHTSAAAVQPLAPPTNKADAALLCRSHLVSG